MKVKDVMTKKVVFVSSADRITDVIELMKKHKLTGVPVVENEKVVGILTDGDIIRALDIPDLPSEDLSPPPFDFIERVIRIKMEEWDVERALGVWKDGIVKDIMTKPAVTINENADIEEAADLMLEKNVHRLPVVNNDGKLVGIVTRHDLLKVLTR